MPPVGCWAGHARGINSGWSGAFQTTPKPGGSLLGSVGWGSRRNKSPGGRRSLGSGAPRAPEPLLEATGAVERGRGEGFLPLLPPHGAPRGAFMESRGAAGARGGSHLGSASLLGEFLARGRPHRRRSPSPCSEPRAAPPRGARLASTRAFWGEDVPSGQVIPYLTPYPHLATPRGGLFPISPHTHTSPRCGAGCSLSRRRTHISHPKALSAAAGASSSAGPGLSGADRPRRRRRGVFG